MLQAVHCLCHFRCAAASVKVSVPLPHSLVLITKVNLGIFSGDLFPKNTSSTRVPLSHSKKLTLSVFVTSRLCWVVSVKLSVPYPAAAWSSVCTGWWWQVCDVSFAVATTIWEENTYIDHTFDICAGNVERHTDTRVVPNRRPDQNTHTEREKSSLRSSYYAENLNTDKNWSVKSSTV